MRMRWAVWTLLRAGMPALRHISLRPYEHLNFPLEICFGFRASDFGFRSLPVQSIELPLPIRRSHRHTFLQPELRGGISDRSPAGGTAGAAIGLDDVIREDAGPGDADSVRGLANS